MEPVVAILAGGRASRMGGAKAGLELAGETMLGRMAGLARLAGLEPLVVAKPGTELPDARARVLREPAEPEHPLAGVVAALGEVGAGLVVVACDMPLVPPALLRRLARAEGLVVCRSGRGLEPLLGRYPAAAAAPLAGAIERGEPAARAVEALAPEVLGPVELAAFGEPEVFLTNVNTPADAARAAALIASRR